MMKKILLSVCMVCVLVTCGCQRQKMTAEYETESEPDDMSEDEYEEVQVEPQYEIESDYEFMKNPLRTYEKEEKRTRTQLYFENKLSKEQKQNMWDEIKSFSEVKRSLYTLYEPGNIYMELAYINPKYYKHLIAGGADESLVQSRGYLDFIVYIYTADDIDKVTFSFYHATKEQSDSLNVEEWPFYIEEGEEIEIRINDEYDDFLTKTIIIDEVTDELPWYLEKAWTATESILMLPKDVYFDWFGEDVKDENISGLRGFEQFFVETQDGKLEEFEKKVNERGVETASESFLEDE